MELTNYHDYIQLNKEIDRIYHETAVRLGLPDSVMALLYSLWEEGDGLTPTQLYAEWSLSKQTGHSALQWLEKRGLIRLAPLPGDGRSKGIFLTDRGRQYAQKAVAPQISAEQAAFDRLTGEEQALLLSLTQKAATSLKEEMAGLTLPATDELL